MRAQHALTLQTQLALPLIPFCIDLFARIVLLGQKLAWYQLPDLWTFLVTYAFFCIGLMISINPRELATDDEANLHVELVRQRLLGYSQRIATSDEEPETSEPIRRPKKARRVTSASKKITSLEIDYTLFNREFFSWIASSKEYLFLIDITSIYSDENPKRAIADITARIKTSWQVIDDATSERGILHIRSLLRCHAA
jgi:hypothetical protein